MIAFDRLYGLLFAEHGPQDWWPARGPFEIMAGALLVQRTTWLNAERAVGELRTRELLDPVALDKVELTLLEQTVRCAGFYRSKARSLQALARFVTDAGGIAGLAARPTDRLRADLLAVHGIGNETADTILLYAFGRPVAVIDSYLRRLVRRLSGSGRPPPDPELAAGMLAEISDAPRLNELHALVVEHGKRICGKLPRCADCCLRSLCAIGTAPSEP